MGLFGLVLLVLLVLVLAHSLIMGTGHADEDACGTCVVVLMTGLAAVVALTSIRSATAPAWSQRPSVVLPVSVVRSMRPPPLRTTVLRL